MAQRITTWDGQSWLLDPGALFLDFVYTGEFGVGAWHDGIFHSADGLDAWLAEHVTPDLRPTTSRELTQALTLRDSLSRLVKHAAGMSQSPEDRDTSIVMRCASKPDIPPMLPGHDPDEPFTTAHALSTIARDAVVHLRDHPDRLRNCCGDDCPMVYLDLSRAGRRAWCSMSRCGNRAKARAYRARAAGRTTHEKE